MTQGTQDGEPPLVLTGLTGRLGGAIAEAVAAQGIAARALIRPTANTAHLQRLGLPTVYGDLRRPRELADALRGASTVLLLTGDAPDQVEMETALVDAAVRCGARHLVKVSAQSAGLEPPVSFGRLHRRSEQAVEASGLPFTILRPTFFMQSLLLAAAPIGRGVLPLPAGSGRVAMIDRRDVARATAAALSRPTHTEGTWTLTGPRALDFREVAASISRTTGRRVRHLDPPLPVARLLLMAGGGLSRWESGLVVELFGALRENAQAPVTDGVEQLTGVRPHGLEQFLQDHRDALSRDKERT